MDQMVQEALDAFGDAENEQRKRLEEIRERALEQFDEAVEAEAENRREWIEDFRFARLGEQWPAEVRAARERDNRPCLTINRLPAFLRQVVNDGRQNRPAITVKPVDSMGDPATAQVISGLIRNIEYSSDADVAYDTALECAATGGFGFWRVRTKHAHDDSFDLDIAIDRVANPLTVYGDPRSTAADSSDWNVAFVTEMVPLATFKATYRGAEASSFDADSYDRLQGGQWRDGDDVRVAEYWRRDEERGELVQLNSGAVMDGEDYLRQQELFALAGLAVTGSRPTTRRRVRQILLSGAEVLSETAWPGVYIPIVPVYGDEVNIEGKRYFRSLIRDAKDAQRMMNYWRTTSTELVALAPRAPWIGPKGFANSSRSKWATANVENHPFLEYDGAVPPQRQGFTGPPAGALQEALNASDDMKAITGLHDASLGARSNETSGVAIAARQREGDVSTFHFLDNLSRAIKHTGRILIDLIPKVYTGARMVRVLGPDGNAQNVPVNQRVQMPNGAAGIFDLTAGKYDLTVQAGPNYTTKRQEAAAQMVEFMRVMPGAAQFIGDLLVKNLDWPGAEEIAQRLRAMLPPQLQGGGDPRLQQMQQAIQQLQGQLQQGAQAYQALQAELQRAKGELSIKAREAEIKAYGAETDRLQAVGAAMTPQQVQMLVWQTLRQLMNSPDVAQPPQPQQPMQPQPMQPQPMWLPRPAGFQ
ncbi:MAG TPA: portal protein [Rubrivivax sp.]|nr:portal protein [Rubrivivax sp.]